MTRQLELARKGQISSTPLELGPKVQLWKSFEFVTKKKGASGPSKTECLSYYAEKYAYLYNNLDHIMIMDSKILYEIYDKNS